MERKIHFRENWLIFLGIWGEAELISRIWGAKENTFRELRNFLSGIWGDQCIVSRERKIHFRENWLIFLGIWGAEIISRIWGAKEKYFQGAEEFSFRDLGRSMHYFQGSRGHRPPGGLSNILRGLELGKKSIGV